MDKQRMLSWTLAKCSELVSGYLIAHHADWNDIDQAIFIDSWEKSEEMFTFILCMRKTGSDMIILDRNRQIDSLNSDINKYLIKRHNEKFYIVNPFFKAINEVSSLEALAWSDNIAPVVPSIAVFWYRNLSY